jgi:hypothetical protein
MIVDTNKSLKPTEFSLSLVESWKGLAAEGNCAI